MAEKLSVWAIDLGVDDPVVFTTRAEVLKNLGRFASSLQSYREAKIRYPASDYAWVGIADVLNEMGRYDESLFAYREAQERFPDVSVTFNGYASVLRAQGKRKEAVEYALSVIARFPEDAACRSNLASALRDLGRYHQAARHYEASLQLDGRSVITILGYVSTLCLTDAGVQGSLRYLDDRLRLMPESVGLLNAKAVFLRRAGLLSESLKLIEKLMIEQPTYTPARFTYAATLVDMGRLDDAKQVLPVTEELRSETDWLGYRIYAIALLAEGHFVDARELLQRSLESCPWRKQRIKLQTILGYVEMKLGEAAESVINLERDMKLLDDNNRQARLILLGQAQTMLGNFSVANRFLQMVHTKDPHLGAMRQRISTSVYGPPPSLLEVPDRLEVQFLLAA